MSVKLKNGNYACGYCGKQFNGKTAQSDADTHKEEHDLIYLQISKEDLQKLVLFIFSKDERLLGEDLVNRLQSYLKGAFNLELMKGTKSDNYKNS